MIREVQKRPGAKLPQACGFILPPRPGYPLLGCSSAEPNSVSPGNMKHTMHGKRAGRYQPNGPPGNVSIDASGYQPNAPTGSWRSWNPQNPYDWPLPMGKLEEITGRNPTNHWLVSTRPSVAGLSRPATTGVFQKMDANHDGILTIQEFRRQLADGRGESRRSLKELVSLGGIVAKGSATGMNFPQFAKAYVAWIQAHSNQGQKRQGTN